MINIKTGSCHCGAVKFEIDIGEGIGELRRCNCSLCSKKGAVMAGIKLDKLTVTHGENNLALYKWNEKIAKHYFCKTCGIYTHHQRRFVPDEFGVNVACLDDADTIKGIEPVMVDGASR